MTPRWKHSLYPLGGNFDLVEGFFCLTGYIYFDSVNFIPSKRVISPLWGRTCFSFSLSLLALIVACLVALTVKKMPTVWEMQI